VKELSIFGTSPEVMYQGRALGATILGKRVDAMSNDERLAAIGYLLEKLAAFNKVNCKRDDCSAALRRMMGLPEIDLTITEDKV
jgi:hypothetical protein